MDSRQPATWLMLYQDRLGTGYMVQLVTGPHHPSLFLIYLLNIYLHLFTFWYVYNNSICRVSRVSNVSSDAFVKYWKTQ